MALAQNKQRHAGTSARPGTRAGLDIVLFLGLALFDSSLPVSLAAHQVLYIHSLLPVSGIACAQIPFSTQSAETMESSTSPLAMPGAAAST